MGRHDHLAIGADRAAYEPLTRSWVFRDHIPAWENFALRPEDLLPPDEQRRRAEARAATPPLDASAILADARAIVAQRLLAAASPEEEAGLQARYDALTDEIARRAALGEAAVAAQASLPAYTWVVVALRDPAGAGPPPQLRSAYESFRRHGYQEPVLAAVFAHYERERPAVVEWAGEDDEVAPPIDSPAALRHLMQLRWVHVHEPASRAGEPAVCPIGLEFACTWEEEHGLGVRLIGGRVTEIGHASCAYE